MINLKDFFKKKVIGVLEKSIAGWIIQPRIIIRTPDARLQINRFAGHLLGGELARVRHPARGVPVHDALLAPTFEILRVRDRARVLNPLDHLRHRHEIDVVVVREDLVDPVEERLQKFRIVFEPGGVEVETERRAIFLVMPIEIVIEEIVELIAVEDVRARVDHGASGEVFVVGRVFATVQFV